MSYPDAILRTPLTKNILDRIFPERQRYYNLNQYQEIMQDGGQRIWDAFVTALDEEKFSGVVIRRKKT